MDCWVNWWSSAVSTISHVFHPLRIRHPENMWQRLGSALWVILQNVNLLYSTIAICRCAVNRHGASRKIQFRESFEAIWTFLPLPDIKSAIGFHECCYPLQPLPLHFTISFIPTTPSRTLCSTMPPLGRRKNNKSTTPPGKRSLRKRGRTMTRMMMMMMMMRKTTTTEVKK